MADQITLDHKTKMDRPTIEISPTGNIVIVLPKAPVKFEQEFDDEKLTYTFRAIWSG